MTPVLTALIPIFLAIIAGFLIRRFVIRNQAHWVPLELLTYYVLFPVLIIEAMATADLHKIPALGVGAALFLSIITMSFLLIATRPLLMKRLQIGGPAFTSVFQGATRWNSVVGIAVAASLYGEIGIALCSVAIVAMVPVLNIINVAVLARHAAARPPPPREYVRALIANPMIWACLVGIALFITHPPIPPVIHDYGRVLNQFTLVVGLLQVGSGLQIEELFRPRAVTLLTTALKLALMPALAASLGFAFGLSGANLAVVISCAAVPTAASAYVLARQMGGDAPLVAQIVTVQTALAMLTIPAVLALAT